MNLIDSALARRVRASSGLRPLGVAAYRLADRVIPAGNGPMVVANSMPKSGTHLIGGLLGDLPGMRFNGRYAVFEYADRADGQWRVDKLDRLLGLLRRGHFMGAHLVHDPRIEAAIKASGARMVTILRDPRAVVVSGLHYVVDTEHMRQRAEALEVFPTREAMLQAMVFGHGEPGDRFYSPDIGARFAAYVDWTDAGIGHTLAFEDLVGRQGGGDDERQHAAVVRLLKYLGYDEAGLPVGDLADRLFSQKSATFRKGRVDSWREDLTPDMAGEIARLCRPTMERLGYPE